MPHQELKKFIIDNGYPTGRELRTQKYQQFVYDLKEATTFLDESYDAVKAPTRCFVVLNDITEVQHCGYCGCVAPIGPNRVKVNHYYKNGFRAFCSQSCTSKGTLKKREETNLKRYGSKHHMGSDAVKEKIRKTNMERYGAACYISSKEFQESYKEEYFERTGYTHHFSNPEVIEARSSANIEKYGAKNPFVFAKDKVQAGMISNWGVKSPLQNPDILTRTQATNVERYGVHSPMMNDDVKTKTQQTNLDNYGHKFTARSHYSDLAISVLYDKEALSEMYSEVGNSHVIAKRLGIGSHRTVLQALREHNIDINDNILRTVSNAEKEICQILDEAGINYETSNRSAISPKEIDILIPDHDVAIEYNGVYWHSDVYKDRNYHQQKSLDCKELGILLIHVYEDQWANPVTKEIIKEKILQKCNKSFKEKVYARKCEIVSVTALEAREFYTETHIQAYNDSKINYGLMYNGSLVSCISFKKLTGKDSGYYDLVRYATSKNVVGGFSRLLRHFQRNNEWVVIETFASLDYSHGDVYEKSGFMMSGITEPNYHYFKGLERHSRNVFMKHKLSGLLENFDETMTEKENMNIHGYTIMYDAGSIKYKIKA
jgi:hypothetical protein